ncbi:MAG: hypothetical protein U0Q15_19950 [Kineosporiaceae bacterium]
MNAQETALWWARLRSGGPQQVAPGVPSPGAAGGVRRLVEPDGGAIWLVPVVPETSGPAVLAELGLPALTAEQPNDTARVLAAVLRCCWPDPAAALWPGVPASFAAVASVLRGMVDRDPAAFHRACVGAIRRLDVARWVLWDESARVVRLGPRVAQWTPADLTVLRQLYRAMPAPAADAVVVLPEDGDGE